MEVKEIVNVMKNFIKDEDRAILFTGTWGIGKTYHIFKFLEDKKFGKDNNYTYLYITLFGKKSLDEVNTELYNMINGKRKMVLNIISSVVKLLGVSVNIPLQIDKNNHEKKINIEANITAPETNNKNEKVKGSKKKYLIIIDDFERKSETITNDDALGYIHGLILQGFKVVVLADLNNAYGKEKHSYNIIKNKDEKYKVLKINWGEDILGEYKEKIFDRIYEIRTPARDVVNDIVGENKVYVIENILDLVDKNLRFVCKTNNLFNKIKKYIEEHDYKFARYTELFTVCCFIVIEGMTNKFVNQLRKEEKDSYNLAKPNQLRVIAFERFIKGTYFFTEMDYINLIYAVIDVFESERYDSLDAFLSPVAKQNNPLLEESIFYLSDEDKEKKIKEQYEYILQAESLNKTEKNAIKDVIKSWYRFYYAKINNLISENELFKKLNYFNCSFHKFHDDLKYDSFIDRYNSFVRTQKRKEIKGIMDTYPSEDFDYDRIKSYLLSNDVNEYLKEFINELKAHSFLISQIHGTIKPRDWELAHEICSFFTNLEPQYRKLLYNYLKKYKRQNQNDKSLKERIEVLISYFGLKI